MKSHNIKSFLAAGLILLAGIYSSKAQQFNTSSLDISSIGNISNPTSIQFGPDNKLYVANQDGIIRILDIERTGTNSYKVIGQELVQLVKNMPNYNDDGSPAPGVNKRQVTGIYVTGTAQQPIIYLASSDPRMGAGERGDVDLCTNSGIVSRLYKEGNSWKKLDLVRGLPHSEENHAPNGIVLDKVNNQLLLAIGGMTNAGGPSRGFTYISEYALAACVVSIDLTAIDAMPVKDPNGANPYVYDIPTLDDPTRPNNPDGTDINDPFGGNDGLNQAKIVKGGPVQVYARGFRNSYDVIITSKGNVYTIDNGANPQWGGFPAKDANGNPTNEYLPNEPGSIPGPGIDPVNNLDGLHLIGNVNNYQTGAYYGGHPNPLRANPAGAGLFTHSGPIDAGVRVWRTDKNDSKNPLPSDWPPVPLDMAFPQEGTFQNPGKDNSALITFESSTNGFCEYTASNFSNSMKGDLLTCSYDGYVDRIRLNEQGNQVLNQLGNSRLNKDQNFASGFSGKKPLDVCAQGDDQIFPGTIWVALYTGEILVYEPDERDIPCTGANDANLDEDFDGYSNMDEILNGTNPCSGASRPEDFDRDGLSDLLDDDDDNDGITDEKDYFARDQTNGLDTYIPLSYQMYNSDPGTGFFGLGFTGLMSNQTTDYLQLYDTDNLVAGGAAGAITINETPEGDAFNNINNQMYAFQFGININKNTPPFIIKVRMKGPFFNGNQPANNQSIGAYIGVGDQDNYLKAVLSGDGGQAGIEVAFENGGVQTSDWHKLSNIPQNGLVLQFLVNPGTGSVGILYEYDGYPVSPAGNPITLQGPLLETMQGNNAMAIGIIATSRNSSQPFNATWDFIEVYSESVAGVLASTRKSTRLKFYPNPTSNNLFIETAESGKAQRIEVLAPTGILLKSYNAADVSSGTEISLNMRDLKEGLYFVKIIYSENNNEEIIQIIKR